MSTGPAGSVEAQNFTWLLRNFAAETPGVIEAIAVSADGLLMATSGPLGGEDTDRLAAISSSLLSLAIGVGECYQMGDPDKIIVKLRHGHMLVSTIRDDSVLAVLAAEQAELAAVAYQTELLIQQVRAALTPQLAEELKIHFGV